jgi:hypothetical protein
MPDIGGIQLTDFEVKEAKRLLAKVREQYSDEQIIEHGVEFLIGDNDPREWAREILRDLDEVSDVRR